MQLVWKIFALCAITVQSNAANVDDKASVADKAWNGMVGNLRDATKRSFRGGGEFEIQYRNDRSLCIWANGTGGENRAPREGQELHLLRCSTSGNKDNRYWFWKGDRIANVASPNLCLSEKSPTSDAVVVTDCGSAVKLNYADWLHNHMLRLKRKGNDKKCVQDAEVSTDGTLLILAKCDTRVTEQRWSPVHLSNQVLEE
mmetsp:Transcript_12659/g.15973  ORF Transcript_12659/g.15973 Transcript_12659/m.15973 type:complete len:200 (-) Transcript_12659:66-665(-)